MFFILTFLITQAFAEPMEWCPFCNGERIRGWTNAAHQDFLTSRYNPFPDAPVISSKHFTAYITKGAFTPHYFLLVSKEHFIRIADLPREHLEDLKSLKRFFERYFLETLKTEFIAFEHGARAGCHAGGGKGGCIDHLHLHMLPFAKSRLRDKVMEDQRGELAEPQKLRDFMDMPIVETDYLFLQDVNGEMMLFPVTGEIPSQLMRKIVARELGRPDEWNWREAADQGDFLMNSIETFRALAAHRISCMEVLTP